MDLLVDPYPLYIMDFIQSHISIWLSQIADEQIVRYSLIVGSSYGRSMQVGVLFFVIDNDDIFNVTTFLLAFKWYIYNMLCR